MSPDSPSSHAARWLPWLVMVPVAVAIASGVSGASPYQPVLIASMLCMVAQLFLARTEDNLLPEVPVWCIVMLGLLQGTGLPEGVHRALSPEGGRLLDRVDWSGFRSLTVSPHATQQGVTMLVVVAVLHRVGRVASTVADGRCVLRPLLIAGAMVAVMSLVAGSPAQGGSLRHSFPFKDPNHLAAFLGLVLPAGVLLLFDDGVPGGRWGRILAGALLALCVAALAATGSRLGTAIPLVGVCGLVVLRSGLPRPDGATPGAARRRGLRVAVAVGAVILGLAVGGGVLLQRWAALGGEPTVRVDIASAGLEAALRFPWTGAGLGSFAEAFPAIQREDLAGSWTHPHNEAVAVLFEVGFPGLLLAAVASGAVFLGLARRARLPDPARGGTAAVALVSLWGLGTHAMLDTVLRSPAVFLAAAALAGIGLGRPWRSIPPEEAGRALRLQRLTGKIFIGIIVVAAIGALTTISSGDRFQHPMDPLVHLEHARNRLQSGDPAGATTAVRHAAAVAGTREPALREIRDLRLALLWANPTPEGEILWLEAGHRVVAREPGWLRRYLEEGEKELGDDAPLHRLVPSRDLPRATWAEFLMHRGRPDEAREALEGVTEEGIPEGLRLWFRDLRERVPERIEKAGSLPGR